MKFVVTKEEGKGDLEDAEKIIQRALEGAVKDTAKLAVQKGRANIAAAGFSGRWQRGVKSRFYANRKTGSPAAIVYHANPLSNVFEKGITVAGKRLLWLPIEKNLPKGVTSPKQYGGKLVSVNVAGKPSMLFDANNRLKGPLFFATRSVHIRKRFDLIRVWTEASQQLDEFFDQRMKEAEKTNA